MSVLVSASSVNSASTSVNSVSTASNIITTKEIIMSATTPVRPATSFVVTNRFGEVVGSVNCTVDCAYPRTVLIDPVVHEVELVLPRKPIPSSNPGVGFGSAVPVVGNSTANRIGKRRVKDRMAAVSRKSNRRPKVKVWHRKRASRYVVYVPVEEVVTVREYAPVVVLKRERPITKAEQARRAAAVPRPVKRVKKAAPVKVVAHAATQRPGYVKTSRHYYQEHSAVRRLPTIKQALAMGRAACDISLPMQGGTQLAAMTHEELQEMAGQLVDMAGELGYQVVTDEDTSYCDSTVMRISVAEDVAQGDLGICISVLTHELVHAIQSVHGEDCMMRLSEDLNVTAEVQAAIEGQPDTEIDAYICMWYPARVLEHLNRLIDQAAAIAASTPAEAALELSKHSVETAEVKADGRYLEWGPYKGDLGYREMNDIICRAMSLTWDKPSKEAIRLRDAFNIAGAPMLPPVWMKGVTINKMEPVRIHAGAVLKCLFALGVPMVGVQSKAVAVDGGFKTILVPKDIPVTYSSRVGKFLVPAAPQGLIEENKLPHMLDVWHLTDDMLEHLNEVVGTMSDSQLLKFWEAMIPGAIADTDKGILKFSPQQTASYNTVSIVLPKKPGDLVRVCTGGLDDEGLVRGNERRLNPVLDVSGRTLGGLVGLTVVLLDMMNESGNLITQQRVDGYFNTLSNMWVPAENYGAFKEEGEAIHAIYSNSELPLGCTFSVRFPFLHLANITNGRSVGVTSAMGMVGGFIKKGIAALPHKYGTFGKRVVFGGGVNAMGMSIAVDMNGNLLIKEGDTERAITREELPEYWQYLMVRTINDASKAAKFYNRPWTFHGSTFADGTPEHPLEKSKVKYLCDVLDKDGNVVGRRATYVRGVRRRVIYSNSRLTHGSGVASWNPTVGGITYGVTKSQGDILNDYMVPPALRARLEKDAQAKRNAGVQCHWLDGLVEALQIKCNGIVEQAKESGRVYRDGDAILTVFEKFEGYTRDLAVISASNQDIFLERVEVVRLATTDAIRIRFITKFLGEDCVLKLRGPGVKFTTVRDALVLGSGRQDWDIFLNMECVKGELAQLYMFAEAEGDCTYHPDKGVLVMDKTGEVIDLNDVSSRFYQWVEKNTVLETVMRVVNRDYLEYMDRCSPGTIAWTPDQVKDGVDIVVVSTEGDDVYVKETCQCLFGEMLFAVEISTPRENTSPSGLTLEQLVLLESIDPLLALAIVHLSKDFHDGIRGMANLILGELPDPKVVPHFDLVSAANAVNKVARAGKDVKSGRQLMDALGAIYPKGIVIQTSNVVAVHYDFEAISRFAAFSGESGGTGMAADIARFFNELGLPAEKRDAKFWPMVMNQLNGQIMASMASWVTQMSGEEGKGSRVLARLGRTAKLGCTLKVKTVHHMCGYMEGLPVVGLHPDCAAVKKLRIRQGDIVMINRTPMGSVGYCYADISEKYDIAHVYVLAHVWAFINEGDGDGDQIAAFNVSKLLMRDNKWRKAKKRRLYKEAQDLLARGLADKAKAKLEESEAIEFVPKLTYERAASFNKSFMAMGGYALVYGKETNHPFAEFCSHEDKWTKKCIATRDAKRVLPKGIKGKPRKKLITNIPVMEYLDAIDAVASHYQINVGVGYGIASALAFLMADARYRAWVNAAHAAAEQGLDVSISKGGLQVIASEEAERFMKGHMAKDKDLVDLIKATAVAWRLCYEGLGLGGYSEGAVHFYQALNVATNSVTGMVMVYLVDGKPHVEYPPKPGAKPIEGAGTGVLRSGAAYLAELLFDDPAVQGSMRGAMTKLIAARATTLAVSAKERGRNVSPGIMSKTNKVSMAVAGCGRALGQGRYGVREENDFGSDSDSQAFSMFELLEGLRLQNGHRYPVNSTVLQYYFSIGAGVMLKMQYARPKKRADQ